MNITYDPVKNQRNIALRGLSFERAADMHFESSVIFVDDRRDYGELRYVAVGYVDTRLCVLCFTRVAQGIRVISFRKANVREVRRYGEAITIHK
ncbi:MAG: BrnT family toxin [Burkholderiaceae bacterium]|nr:MAG: BrnT family toxin [Burkholderiaceae bacterium]